MREEMKIIGEVRLLPRELAARKLGITEKTFRRWELDGLAPPCTRIGRDVYCEESSLAKWIRAQERDSAA